MVAGGLGSTTTALHDRGDAGDGRDGCHRADECEPAAPAGPGTVVGPGGERYADLGPVGRPAQPLSELLLELGVVGHRSSSVMRARSAPSARWTWERTVASEQPRSPAISAYSRSS